MPNKLDSLDFTTPNNACLSLRVLAEWVRSGEITMMSKADWESKDPGLMLGFNDPKEGR